MSKEEIEELRALIQADRKTRRGPYAAAVRERLQSFLKAKSLEGQSLRRVGEELGLNPHTLQF